MLGPLEQSSISSWLHHREHVLEKLFEIKEILESFFEFILGIMDINKESNRGIFFEMLI